MNRQEIFDKCVAGLWGQGFERSMANYNGGMLKGCAFRGDESRKCAAGHLIDDAHYDVSMEGHLVREVAKPCLVLDKALIESGISGEDFELVAKLQRAHDNGKSPARMRRNLRDVADFYGLALPKVLVKAMIEDVLE